jgi:UDP-3-O-[3-hydroxymyristoyl] glucosamine N-acyltransferase
MQQNKSIEDIAKLLNGKASKKGLFVYRINSLKNANDGDISFYTDSKLKSELLSTKASVVILQKKDINLCPTNYIIVDDPYYAFSQISNLFNPIKNPSSMYKRVGKDRY